MKLLSCWCTRYCFLDKIYYNILSNILIASQKKKKKWNKRHLHKLDYSSNFSLSLSLKSKKEKTVFVQKPHAEEKNGNKNFFDVKANWKRYLEQRCNLCKNLLRYTTDNFAYIRVYTDQHSLLSYIHIVEGQIAH